MEEWGILCHHPQNSFALAGCGPAGAQVGCDVLGGVESMDERVVQEFWVFLVFADNASTAALS